MPARSSAFALSSQLAKIRVKSLIREHSIVRAQLAATGQPRLSLDPQVFEDSDSKETYLEAKEREEAKANCLPSGLEYAAVRRELGMYAGKEMAHNYPPKNCLRKIRNPLRNQIWRKAQYAVGPKKDARNEPSSSLRQ